MNAGALDLTGMAAEVASGLDGVTTTTDGDVTSFARDGTAFARTAPGVFDVGLPDDVSAAALQTPGTSTIDGAGWVRLSLSGQEHVLDRASAWFKAAWQHAGGE